MTKTSTSDEILERIFETISPVLTYPGIEDAKWWNLVFEYLVERSLEDIPRIYVRQATRMRCKAPAMAKY